MACFEFCRGYSDSNPVAGLLNSFGAIIFDPDGLGRPHLKLLHARYGRDSAQWPMALLVDLHDTVMAGPHSSTCQSVNMWLIFMCL